MCCQRLASADATHLWSACRSSSDVSLSLLLDQCLKRKVRMPFPYKYDDYNGLK